MSEKITFKKLSEMVLRDQQKPMTPFKIWEKAQEMGLADKIGTRGETPWSTISAQLYVDIRDNPQSIFIQYGRRPSTFTLKENGNSGQLETLEEDIKPESATSYSESDLHPLLVKYADSAPNFKAQLKTIYHENSIKTRRGMNEWLHPDLVGVHFPFEFEDVTSEIQKQLFWTAVRFFSFEMKKVLDIAHLREYYFQAVSNSSWAHEGYLVALRIEEDEYLKTELRRLNNAFGIGVIELDPKNIMDSKILLPSRIKQELDWDTIDLLLSQNEHFKNFMTAIKDDIIIGKIANKSHYDEVLSDTDFKKYLDDKKIITDLKYSLK
jgi:hypothetical protein